MTDMTERRAKALITRSGVLAAAHGYTVGDELSEAFAEGWVRNLLSPGDELVDVSTESVRSYLGKDARPLSHRRPRTENEDLVVCPGCEGNGWPCHRCDGRGRVQRSHTTVYELGDRVVKFAEKVYGRELELWQRRALREVLTAPPSSPLLVARPLNDLADDDRCVDCGHWDVHHRANGCRVPSGSRYCDCPAFRPRNENYAEHSDQEKQS